MSELNTILLKKAIQAVLAQTKSDAEKAEELAAFIQSLTPKETQEQENERVNQAVIDATGETFENDRISFDYEKDAKIVIFGKEQASLNAFINSFYTHLKASEPE